MRSRGGLDAARAAAVWLHGSTVPSRSAEPIADGAQQAWLVEGAGRDALYAGFGQQTLYAGSGNQELVFGYESDPVTNAALFDLDSKNGGNDTIWGGANASTVDLESQNMADVHIATNGNVTTLQFTGASGHDVAEVLHHITDIVFNDGTHPI